MSDSQKDEASHLFPRSLVSFIPVPSHLHGHPTHFGLTTSIRPTEGRNSHSSHSRQGVSLGNTMPDMGGKGKEKTAASGSMIESVKIGEICG